MFVRKSKFDNLQEDFNELQEQFVKARDYAERLHKLANDNYRYAIELRDIAQHQLDLATERGLTIAELINENRKLRSLEVFTQEEIKTLISLCHPDRHGNSERSNTITSRLLGMRK